ncbi:MAG: hypothetical protein QF733_05740 [Phycisphaerales bacterium]|nr:hypothetical protein [Phycisphaerales bacterium]
MTIRTSLCFLCVLALYAAPRGLAGDRSCRGAAADHHHVHTHDGHTHSHAPARHARPAHADHCEDASGEGDHHHWCHEHRGVCHLCDARLVARVRSVAGVSGAVAEASPIRFTRLVAAGPPSLRPVARCRPPDHLRPLRSVILLT